MKQSAVKILIIVNVLVFVLQDMSRGAAWQDWLALWPLQPIDGRSYFHFWQLVTYAFLHSTQNISHLLFNMLGLWMFGREVERDVGAARLTLCYSASVITAALSQLFVPALFGAAPEPTIGASGGVFGLLLAYAMLFPGVLALVGIGALRKRGGNSFRLFGVVLLLLASVSGLTACSQRYSYLHHPPTANAGTPPGNYPITLTAYSNNGGQVTSHSLQLTLTVK